MRLRDKALRETLQPEIHCRDVVRHLLHIIERYERNLLILEQRQI